jgi:hypothetical protein
VIDGDGRKRGIILLAMLSKLAARHSGAVVAGFG